MEEGGPNARREKSTLTSSTSCRHADYRLLVANAACTEASCVCSMDVIAAWCALRDLLRRRRRRFLSPETTSAQRLGLGKGGDSTNNDMDVVGCGRSGASPSPSTSALGSFSERIETL